MEGGRKERWGGRGRNKYFIGVGNRTEEGVAGSGARGTDWPPGSPFGRQIPRVR